MSVPNKLNLNYLLNDEVEDTRSQHEPHHSQDSSARRSRRLDYPTPSPSMSSLSKNSSKFHGNRNHIYRDHDRSAILTSPSMKLYPLSQAMPRDSFETSADCSNATSPNRRNLARNFKCDLCGKSFFERGNLNKHVSSVHLKEKPKICPEPGCGKSFSFRDGLMRHIAHVHRNQRQYSCNLCQKSFKQASHLGKHMRTIHKAT